MLPSFVFVLFKIFILIFCLLVLDVCFNSFEMKEGIIHLKLMKILLDQQSLHSPLNPAFSVSAPAAVCAAFEVFDVSTAQAKGIQKGESSRSGEVRRRGRIFSLPTTTLYTVNGRIRTLKKIKQLIDFLFKRIFGLSHIYLKAFLGNKV